MAYLHIPVMLQEAVELLDCRSAKIYVDGTLGGAGHAKAICSKIMPEGLLIGIDQDPEAIANARSVLGAHAARIRLFQDNFVHLPEILCDLNISGVDGILLDLGLSRHQLEASGRGFSFQRDEPLDMRMNPDAEISAREIVNTFSEAQLRRILRDYGEEPCARAIARRIVQSRRHQKISTSRMLAQIISAAVPAKLVRRRKIHPATRTFMALRIQINRELEVLDTFMAQAAEVLNTGGRLCVISFHSLEDRIVKRHMQQMVKGCTCPPDFPQCVCNRKPTAKILTPKPLRPSAAEVNTNPFSRSARLRALERR